MEDRKYCFLPIIWTIGHKFSASIFYLIGPPDLVYGTSLNHLNNKPVKVCYSDVSPIQMFAIQIPTLYCDMKSFAVFVKSRLTKKHFPTLFYLVTRVSKKKKNRKIAKSENRNKKNAGLDDA